MYPINSKIPQAERIPKNKKCYLFWEITSECGNNCKFCFRKDGTSHKDLSHGDCLKILNSYREFSKAYPLNANVTFTGGDPLLRGDFMDILEIAAEYQRSGAIKNIRILCNPDYINEEIARRLKSLSPDIICRLNIDGLETTHDFIRKPGGFKKTINAFRCLHDVGITAHAAFCLYRANAKELLDVIRRVISENISKFVFFPITPVGAGSNLENDLLLPSEYRKLLIDVLGLLDSLPGKHQNLKNGIIAGGHLFSLLFYELGRWNEYLKIRGADKAPETNEQGIIFAVLPDGDVYLRRLIPIKIGRVPQDSFRKIYESSDLLRSLEDVPYTEKKKAEFAKCRACPAVVYCGQGIGCVHHTPGSIYGPHRMCWVE
ncbi:MAG: radical SAM protein [Planctomycetes bacterium]|nr:radical SAM protein [Planctomycetota bacterium]